MVYLNFGRRRVMSAVAAVPAVAFCLFGVSAPARAHARHDASVHYRHLVRHLMRRRPAPWVTAGFASGMEDYAAAPQGTPQGRRGWNGWRESSWHESSLRQHSNWGPRETGWWRSENSWGGGAQFGALDGMAAAAASEAGVPLSLVQRVIRRESGGNPRAVSRGNYGLMQIRLGTARAMGYSGSAAGLLDPQINMTYAVRYLAGAYRAAGGNEGRAVALYARGYYAQAKTQGFSPYAPASRL